jgi:bleomycin hydrolase
MAMALHAQDTLLNKPGSQYRFTKVYNTEASAVQDQCRTSTCWSFSSLSFLESELLRKGKGAHKLSEMFIVRNAYIEKAIQYIRMNGKCNFDEGGEFHDIPLIIKKYGIVPEEVYKGMNYGEEKHNHHEMVAMLKGMMDKLKDNPQGTYTTSWIAAVEGVVDAYLGKIPEKFTYQGKEYTARSFASFLDLKMDDYVMVTSFTHHDFYKPFAIEVADNWSMQSAYNVPLAEFTGLINHALEKGYSVAWAADVSEKGFSFYDGLGIVPAEDSMVKQKSRDNKGYNDPGGARSGTGFQRPVTEKTITAENRQEAFDKQLTTDDHGMHITGMVREKSGKNFYVVKNSWGTLNYLQGYLYVSENYMQYKTIGIMVHKDALQKALRDKLDID